MKLSHVAVAKRVPKLTVYSPTAFKLPGFKEWLEDPDTVVFTWHTAGQQLGRWSDVILTYEEGEFTDDSMPTELSEWLTERWEEHYPDEHTGIIFLRNYIPNAQELEEDA